MPMVENGEDGKMNSFAETSRHRLPFFFFLPPVPPPVAVPGPLLPSATLAPAILVPVGGSESRTRLSGCASTRPPFSDGRTASTSVFGFEVLALFDGGFGPTSVGAGGLDLLSGDVDGSPHIPLPNCPSPATSRPTSAALSVSYFKHTPETGSYVFRVRLARGWGDGALGCGC